jgi:hypothetical protein
MCGAFAGAEHWTAGAASSAGGGGAAPTLDRRLAAAANNRALRAFGLRLDVWGAQFVLRGLTGKSAVVPHLGALWPEAERLAGRPCDPLDPALIAAMEAA